MGALGMMVGGGQNCDSCDFRISLIGGGFTLPSRERGSRLSLGLQSIADELGCSVGVDVEGYVGVAGAVFG